MAKDYQDRIEQLIYSANEQINNLVESEEDVKELLNFKDKFYKYSLRNMALIRKQFSGAVAVGTFQFWKEHGFHVNRGEKGIEMLVPVAVQSFKNSDGQVKSVKYATKEEKEKINRGEIEVFSVTRFKIGHVFDVSQTNAKASDLPKLFPNRWLDGDVPNYESFYKSLEKVADSIGAEIINTGNELGASKGVTYTLTKEIELNHRNGELQNIKTFIHELAHAKLHSGIRRKQYSKSEREFQAELVAYAVCSHFNLDVSEYSLNYLKNWTQDTDIPTRTKLLEEVYNTTKDFINILEENMTIEKELNSNQEVESEKINLKDCGILLRHFALESINTEQEMYFCEIEDFEDLIDEGIMTKENWEEFEQDLKKFKLVEEGYLELHTDFENFEQDKDQIDCVMTGYMDFWKQFEYDQVINSRFPNKNFRKIIVEQLLDRNDGTTDIFKSDLEVLKKFEVLNLEKHKLTDIKGIENFESLRKLDVSNNPIINLDVSDLIGLKELYAYGCQIHNLKLPKSETLEILDVTVNNLEDLDLEKQSVLKSLSCSGNELSDLGVADCPCLEEIFCSNNFISELDLTENKIIKNIECENNDLKYLSVNSLDMIDLLNLNGNIDVQVKEFQLNDSTISFLTDEQVQSLIEKYDNNTLTENDLGSFYSKNGDKWIGIDNSHGDVFIEEFNSKDYCMKWLNNHELPIPYESMNDLFPDENFRKAILIEVFEQDKLSDNTTLVYEQLPVIQAQEVLLIPNSQIYDLTGIEQFTSLKHLDVSYNPIQTLKGVSSECRKIYASSTHLNELKNEDIPKEIQTLDVAFCDLKTLDVSEREELQFLFSSHNQLEELNFKDCNELMYLTCQDNLLYDLPVQELPMLEQLDCANNFIYNLEVSDGIQWLSCHTNRLTELKLNHCDDLEHLDCAYNNLEVLEIQDLEKLKNIDCRGNERSPHELIHGVTKAVTNEQEKER